MTLSETRDVVIIVTAVLIVLLIVVISVKRKDRKNHHKSPPSTKSSFCGSMARSPSGAQSLYDMGEGRVFAPCAYL